MLSYIILSIWLTLLSKEPFSNHKEAHKYREESGQYKVISLLAMNRNLVIKCIHFQMYSCNYFLLCLDVGCFQHWPGYWTKITLFFPTRFEHRLEHYAAGSGEASAFVEPPGRNQVICLKPWQGHCSASGYWTMTAALAEIVAILFLWILAFIHYTAYGHLQGREEPHTPTNYFLKR